MADGNDNDKNKIKEAENKVNIKNNELKKKNEKINSLNPKERQELATLLEEFIQDQEENSKNNKKASDKELASPQTLEKLEAVIEKLKAEGDIELTPEELELLEKIGVKESWLKKAMNFLLPKVLANFIIASAKSFLGLEPQADKAVFKDDLLKEFEGKAEASKAASNEQQKQQQESQSKETPSKQANESSAALKAGIGESKTKDEIKIPFDESATKIKDDLSKVVDKLKEDSNLKEKIEAISKTKDENNVRDERIASNQENSKDNKQHNSKDKDQKIVQQQDNLRNLYGDDKVNDAKLVEAAKTASTPQKQFEAGVKSGMKDVRSELENQKGQSTPVEKAKGEAKEVAKDLQGKVEPVKGKGDDGKDPSPPHTPKRTDPPSRER
ncbi:MAG: hypothetical protein J0H68_10010 [Sphingobacteriia bacterium]|nr:hypothetical protein [Sphingobacteriia bacterium]